MTKRRLGAKRKEQERKEALTPALDLWRQLVNNARDIYITSDQEGKLDDIMGEQDLAEFCAALAHDKSLKLGKCYIRCNTRQDPPLGDMIIRVEFEGLEADIEAFCKDLLHLIT